MQSVHAGAVQTHFFVFTRFLKDRFQKISFWIHFGDNFHVKLQIWVNKLLPKMIEKKGTPLDANYWLWPFPQAPWQPPSRTRFSKQETTIWARNNNSCSLLSPFLSPFPGIGYFWIICSICLQLLKQIVETKAQTRDLTRPWAKARRIQSYRDNSGGFAGWKFESKELETRSELCHSLHGT